MSDARVLLLHAVDTEGPLFESAAETVARINRIAGLSLPVEDATLGKLRADEIELGGARDVVLNVLRYSEFLGDWGAVRAMLARVMSPVFRRANADSDGRPWVFNWHVMDHVGYDVNPRRRDIGYHNVFDVYRDLIAGCGPEDELGFHFHPDHFYTHAHLCGTTYSTSRNLYAILARRLVDRNWFPRSFRAGFHTERPDSHGFLEQWIPHDFSNQAIAADDSTAGQLDLSHHRFGDWSRAPTEWGWYHPDHDDYQSQGGCRRRIFRCLNIGTRHRCITEQEVTRAFDQVRSERRDVVVAVTNHDFRDMAPDVEWLKRTCDAMSARSGIKWRSASISDTFAPWRAPPPRSAWTLGEDRGLARLSIEYAEPIFGPQPFMAVKLANELYHHVNLDIVRPFRSFAYTFDDNTVPLDRIEAIVIGTNDRHGNVIVDRLKG
jgi:hypothetical protein